MPPPRNPKPEEIEKLTSLYKSGRIAEAEIQAESLATRFPNHGFGWKVLGAIYQAQNRHEDALRATHRAIRLLPGDAATYNNLGTSLLRLQRLEEAESSFRRALSIAPDYAKALSNLGSLLRIQNKIAEAELCSRRALQLDPHYASPYSNLALLLQDQGRVPEAVTCFRNSLTLDPGATEVHSQMLFCLSHDLQTDAEQLRLAHLTFGERFATPLRTHWQPHSNDKNPNRSLEVGFVSGDLNDHAVASFLEPLLKSLAKKSTLKLHAYYTHTRNDTVSQRLQSYFQHWHSVAQLSEASLAEKIRADRIDILIDLSGHTAHNRLLAFARKPAPVQISWLGYPGTTGLQAMDYYLSDKFWLPPGELDWQFTEKPYLLPCSVVFESSQDAPPVNALPAQSKGHITFGSFNRANKLNPSVIALWSMLLRAIPSARMLLGGLSVDHQAKLIQDFSNEGIAPERLSLHPRSTMQDYLALHQQVDVCLDTFPYGGGTTTLHAAWMGVPTLCLAGDTPPSRFGASVMRHLELDAFVATSIEDFIAKGSHWAEHSAELAAIRTELRTRFTTSPLGQPETFAHNFEGSLRNMWQFWCNNSPSPNS